MIEKGIFTSNCNMQLCLIFFPLAHFKLFLRGLASVIGETSDYCELQTALKVQKIPERSDQNLLVMQTCKIFFPQNVGFFFKAQLTYVIVVSDVPHDVSTILYITLCSP